MLTWNICFFLFTCYIYLLFFFSIMFVCTTHVDLVVPWLGLWINMYPVQHVLLHFSNNAIVSPHILGTLFLVIGTSNLVCRADKCSIITTRASKIEPWSCVYTAKDPWEVLTRKTDFGLSSGSPMACPDESRELRRLLSLKLLRWDIV